VSGISMCRCRACEGYQLLLRAFSPQLDGLDCPLAMTQSFCPVLSILAVP
jgi:hypothetical protein